MGPCLRLHLVGILTLLTSSVGSAAPWPMMLQSASHRGEIGKAMELPTSRPHVKWSYQAGGQVEASVVVGEKHVFSAGGEKIFALDRETGEEVWSFKAKAQVLASGALGGDVFMIGADDSTFYALHKDTGKLQWKFRAGEFTGGATVDQEEESVYVGSGDHKLYSYFLNGSKRFVFKATDKVCSTPALSADGVYFGDDKGMFYKLDRFTGKQVWSIKLSHGIRSPARLEDDGIYISMGDPDGTKSGEIVRLSYNGTIQWQSDCGQEGSKCDSCWTSPAVVGDVVVAGCGLDSMSRGFIWGLDKATGKVVWKVAAGNDCQTSSPVNVGDSVILGCIDGSLYALKAADGTAQWAFEASQGIWTTPALDESGTIYIGSHDGNIYALTAVERDEL
eukprot:TRINITY_DN3134_c0_g1_i1.p1 TRINITY_DN3134_c0_g1~~TRINITY_DN3134_c0_g1_i1.p1  ORF type:complete len:407 (-),score=62.15 TRINITY_DN3134_c0_g1_i1:368-1540(-)